MPWYMRYYDIKFPHNKDPIRINSMYLTAIKENPEFITTQLEHRIRPCIQYAAANTTTWFSLVQSYNFQSWCCWFQLKHIYSLREKNKSYKVTSHKEKTQVKRNVTSYIVIKLFKFSHYTLNLVILILVLMAESVRVPSFRENPSPHPFSINQS
jgi:hypothetical protein